ncbi:MULTISPECIES: gliding motility-associated peptidyl-prolyl isomerase GldI [unclassified Robiginitalea]|uniref:gliding motility-associated peptidyl-prolyl isomerase GldI n=1 Tax=Robiginitalea TaxID=252306 RepID=UPI0023497938|nr:MULTISPECIES: gliding motility-associated peptidyl-prolyl isomerase GldI [unclassified Robiginitalea]MDC6354810.1 gliding motility-associated peptidyl-prolyl isomerase GldI [Robiginitalea sp. PM2]MDC6375076.1 gliding motility-associated peptidyl-prolyl isomerase GldI [Robiginitalea sp. SP8]
MKTRFAVIALLLLALGCGEPEVRWPVSRQGGSFLKLSAERNKRLLEQEQALLDRIIEADSQHTYLTSQSGSRYYYLQQAPGDGYTPQPDDLVTLTYDIRTWDNDTIYPETEIGLVRYKVDKQELFPGLRNSVKLLQEGESAVFFFPSSLAFGYHGDQERIGPNLPVQSTLTIVKIEKQSDSESSNP